MCSSDLPALKANEEPGTGSPAEFIGAFRTRTKSGLHVTLGGAGGLSRGIGASTFRVFLGVGYGKLDSGSDRDGDGIIDSLDVCPDVPEIVNGFEDDDGCPDELAKLYVMVEVAGNPQSGVDVRVIGDPATYELASEVDPVPLDIIPGLYVVKGHLPGYTGQASVEVKPGEQDVVLNLEPMSPAHVTVVVLDPSEQPLYGAGISFAGQNAPL